MKLREIRTFVAVAEAQSIQAAAARLGLTQSAVSRLVQRLEAELGATLFDRQTKPFAVTADGRLALTYSRQILQATDSLAQAFSHASAPRGPFRLGVSHALTAFAAGAPLDRIRTDFPDLNLSLLADWTGALLDRVRDGTLDGALVLLADDHAPPPALTSRRLGEVDIGVIAPAHDRRTERNVGTINAIGWVIQPQGCGFRSALERALARHGVSLNVAVEAFGQDLQLALISRGIGYGLAPVGLLPDNALSSGVRVTTVDDFHLRIAIWLVRGPYPGRLTVAFEALADTVIKGLAEPHSRSE